MLYITIDNTLAKADDNIIDILWGAGDELREMSLEQAQKFPVSVNRFLYKGKLLNCGNVHPLSEDCGEQLNYGNPCVCAFLTVCAMVAVYTVENKDISDVLIYHARGGEISDDCDVLRAENKSNKVVVYAVTRYENHLYDKYIAKLTSAGYLSRNICIITGISCNHCFSYDGGAIL